MDSKKKPINEGYQPHRRNKRIELPVSGKVYGYQPLPESKISTKGTPPKSGSRILPNNAGKSKTGN